LKCLPYCENMALSVNMRIHLSEWWRALGVKAEFFVRKFDTRIVFLERAFGYTKDLIFGIWGFGMDFCFPSDPTQTL